MVIVSVAPGLKVTGPLVSGRTMNIPCEAEMRGHLVPGRRLGRLVEQTRQDEGCLAGALVARVTFWFSKKRRSTVLSLP